MSETGQPGDGTQSPFDRKVESVAAVLDEIPPMQVLKAVERLVEDPESRLDSPDLATAASNVCDEETLINAVTNREAIEQ